LLIEAIGVLQVQFCFHHGRSELNQRHKEVATAAIKLPFTLLPVSAK
jgi:hypothetical protein